MNNNLKIPTFDELMQPAINALVSLGGSGSIGVARASTPNTY